MWYQLKHKILQWYLLLKKKKQQFHTPISLTDAKSVGILFNASDIKMNDVIVEFAKRMKSERKDVQLLGYIPKREFGFQYPFPYISNKDITWYGKPGGGTTGFFTKSPFDLLINFCDTNLLPLEYISATSVAKFRIGFNKEIDNSNYDLILISNEKSNISKLISDLECYLK